MSTRKKSRTTPIKRSKPKSRCGRGVKILSDVEVEWMRQLREDHNLSYREIAAKMECPKITAYAICTYRRRCT
jgi:hypothetical protein